MRHENSTRNHKIENWTYANAAARTGATGFVTADLGRIAYQSDDGSYWRLTATTPTWAALGSGEPGGGGALAKGAVQGIANQAIPTGSTTAVTLDFGVFGTESGIEDVANDQLIAPADGYYRLYAALKYAANATGVRGLRIYVNGSAIFAKYTNFADASLPTLIDGTCLTSLDAGDLVTLQAYQTSGGNLSIVSSTDEVPMSPVLMLELLQEIVP